MCSGLFGTHPFGFWCSCHDHKMNFMSFPASYEGTSDYFYICICISGCKPSVQSMKIKCFYVYSHRLLCANVEVQGSKKFFEHKGS